MSSLQRRRHGKRRLSVRYAVDLGKLKRELAEDPTFGLPYVDFAQGLRDYIEHRYGEMPT